MYKLNKVESTSAIVVAGNIRAQTKFSNGIENIEEWSSKSSSNKQLRPETMELLMRKWRGPDKMGRIGNWEYEVSQPIHHAASNQEEIGSDIISINKNENPIWSSEWTPSHLLWKATNSVWPFENYSVTVVDDAQQTLVVRSKNKKLFKKIQIPALARIHEKLNDSAVDLEYNSKLKCLTILYKKSEAVLKQEEEEKMRVIQAYQRLRWHTAHERTLKQRSEQRSLRLFSSATLQNMIGINFK